MNLASRLIELRKKFNYSQEELASLLNISRQSISKREKGESVPSIEYIKELARIYNISIDDLLNENKPIEECYAVKDIVEEKENDNEKVKEENRNEEDVVIDVNNRRRVNLKYNFKKGLSIFEDNNAIYYSLKFDKNRKIESIVGIITAIFFGLLLAAYVVLGLVFKEYGFKLYWPLLFLPYFIPSIIKCIYYRSFRYLELGAVSLAAYLFIGMYGTIFGGFNGWHPYWVILFIPTVYYTVFSNFDKLIRMARAKKLKNNPQKKIVIEK